MTSTLQTDGDCAAPASAAVLKETAFSRHEQGDLAAAERGYREVLRHTPDDLEILHALGLLAAQTGRLNDAVELYARVLRIRESAAVHSDLGTALCGLSRFADAIRSCDRAIALGDDTAEVLTLRGVCQAGLGLRDQALLSFEAAIARHAGYAPAHINRAVVLRDCNRAAEALAGYGDALALAADSFEALYNRAALLTDLGRFNEALMDCSRARALRPNQAEIHLASGTALLGLERFDEALQSYDIAVALRPAYAEAHAGRAGALQYLQRHAEALQSSERAIQLDSRLATAHFNRGAALRDLMLIDDAVKSFEKARTLRPEDADANCNLGGLLLLQGKFDRGWGLYEWRSRMPDAPAFHRYSQPRWDGTADVRGKTVFVYLDQGLGDSIQFSRYAKLLEFRGARVVMSVQDRLRRLLTGLSPTIRLLGESEAPESFDYHCPMASLPGLFGTTAETIPSQPAYLAAEAERAALWRHRLGHEGFRIGICWHGSTIKTGIGRSFPLNALRGISMLPRVRLISLQQGVGTEQIADLPPGVRVETLGEAFDDGPDAFVDTAAVMDNLDLVITCDTSVAHLAGALGRPAWVVLKRVPDWRWMLERSDCPWYPSLRLFRQTIKGHWDDVFEAMHRELRARIEPPP